ncbi:lipoprotein [Inhella sp.]
MTLAASVLMVGCGQKGPLKLPPPKSVTASAAVPGSGS